jgi:hypothetical protein
MIIAKFTRMKCESTASFDVCGQTLARILPRNSPTMPVNFGGAIVGFQTDIRLEVSLTVHADKSHESCWRATLAAIARSTRLT